jgi:hypothetical protein
MVKHKDKIENQFTWVLTKEGRVLATFGNLKTLVEHCNDGNLPKYNTLVRKKDYPLGFGEYEIWHVKHHTGKYTRK